MEFNNKSSSTHRAGKLFGEFYETNVLDLFCSQTPLPICCQV